MKTIQTFEEFNYMLLKKDIVITLLIAIMFFALIRNVIYATMILAGIILAIQLLYIYMGDKIQIKLQENGKK